MTSHSGPIYEVTFFVAPDIAEDCERRVAIEHVVWVKLWHAVGCFGKAFDRHVGFDAKDLSYVDIHRGRFRHGRAIRHRSHSF